jgi:hypothetical protein
MRRIGYQFVRGNGSNAPEGLLTSIVGSGVSPIVGAGSEINDGLTEQYRITRRLEPLEEHRRKLSSQLYFRLFPEFP